MTELLTVRDASCTVGVRVLWQQLSFGLRAGDRLVASGPSGVGKSLLLRGLADLEPLQGECLLRGRPSTSWPAATYRSQVMYVPQRPGLGSGTVSEFLQAPFGFAAHQEQTFSAEAAAELLADLGRDESLLGQSCQKLSGGEAQSVLLTRALLLQPCVLLLDEVTSALDAALAARAEAALLAWVNAGDRSLIWVGHDPAARQRIGTAELVLEPVARPSQEGAA